MGKDSRISWTNHTFNPWWGCTKVSPGCEHCYAERDSMRYHQGMWGPLGYRKAMSDNYWEQLKKWDRAAWKADKPAKVFVASMSDIFEDFQEPLVTPEPLKLTADHYRQLLWREIEQRDNLIFLLLTKRPENIQRMVPVDWLTGDFPPNLWLGVSIENQKYIHRLAQLAEYQVSRFVSIEPMLGAVDFGDWWYAVDWVIVGGESGPEARPMHPTWARDLRDMCRFRRIPFFFKQWGEWEPLGQSSFPFRQKVCVWSDGRTATEWSLWDDSDGVVMVRAGRKNTGNRLDTNVYEEFPNF